MNEVERNEWLAKRRTGISGTDVSAILGINPWASPLDVWLDKRGQAEPRAESMAMKLGNLLEPVVATLYADETGAELVDPGFLRHPSRDWHIGTPDRITVDGTLIEIKTAERADGWGEPETAEIPDHYWLQCQHQLEVVASHRPETETCWVFVLIGQGDFRRYRIADLDRGGNRVGILHRRKRRLVLPHRRQRRRARGL